MNGTRLALNMQRFLRTPKGALTPVFLILLALAGPVVAAAVILNPRRRIHGLADSKVLPVEERERLAPIIRERALAWAVAWKSMRSLARNMIGMSSPSGE